MAVLAKRITAIVSKLEYAKCAGSDRHGVECLKFSNTKMHVPLLLLLCPMFLSHAYLLAALIKTTVVPVVKRKVGNFTNNNNI